MQNSSVRNTHTLLGIDVYRNVPREKKTKKEEERKRKHAVILAHQW